MRDIVIDSDAIVRIEDCVESEAAEIWSTYKYVKRLKLWCNIVGWLIFQARWFLAYVCGVSIFYIAGLHEDAFQLQGTSPSSAVSAVKACSTFHKQTKTRTEQGLSIEPCLWNGLSCIWLAIIAPDSSKEMTGTPKRQLQTSCSRNSCNLTASMLRKGW